ncbi:MAG: HD domain-containing protein [Desulfobulbaceae bacterium]|uniref:HD domain-containing protein n=1 Tax=Candidatus Desulfobia pelagia TaxID=2841692 RepID=A0A8J6NCM1_9BACT|nr:HD domain-containing protein [Candidatus Desulfobia pelagia]
MIISDILMPVMDGFQLCRMCQEDDRLSSIPFVFYSASYTERQDQEFGLGMGAVRFIVKPMDPDEFLKTIREILKDYENGLLLPSALPVDKDEDTFLKGYSGRLIRQLEKKVEDLEESNKALMKSEADLKDLFESFVMAMVNALEAKSRWTTGHSRRVAHYAEQLALEIDLGPAEIAEVKMAALLHDIGKLGLKDNILDKPSHLTEEEFRTVKEHAALGAEILHDIKPLRHITPSIRHHHEKSDGSGYPDGITGRDIGLFAGILHIADSFDAITSDRPYRSSLSKEYAVEELKKFSGKQFDPVLVDAFLRVLDNGFRCIKFNTMRIMIQGLMKVEKI